MVRHSKRIKAKAREVYGQLIPNKSLSPAKFAEQWIDARDAQKMRSQRHPYVKIGLRRVPRYLESDAEIGRGSDYGQNLDSDSGLQDFEYKNKKRRFTERIKTRSSKHSDSSRSRSEGGFRSLNRSQSGSGSFQNQDSDRSVASDNSKDQAFSETSEADLDDDQYQRLLIR
jgi:hypothetical protein